MKVCVALVRPVEAKVRVFEPTRPVLPRPLNVATPFTAFTVAVPVSAPEEMVTVTAAVEVVTTLSCASRTSTTGCVVKSVRLTKPAACVVNTSLVAEPACKVTNIEAVYELGLVIVAVMVLVPTALVRLIPLPEKLATPATAAIEVVPPMVASGEVKVTV